MARKNQPMVSELCHSSHMHVFLSCVFMHCLNKFDNEKYRHRGDSTIVYLTVRETKAEVRKVFNSSRAAKLSAETLLATHKSTSISQ